MKTLKLFKIKILKLDMATWIAVFLFLMQNCLYLIDVNKINTSGSINYSDGWAVLLLIFMVVVMYKYRNVHLPKPEFRWIIAIQIILCFLAAWQELRLTGQSFLMGIRPQRFRILIMLSYFPLRKLFLVNKITILRVKEIVFKYAIIAATLSIIQQLVYNQFIFMYCKTDIRYGSVRLYLSTCVIVFAMFFAIENLMKRDFKVINFVMIALGFVYLLFVVKGRWHFIAICAAVVVAVIIMNKNVKQKLVYLAIIIISVFALLQTPLVSDLLSDNTDGGNTMEIRYEGRELYFNTLKKHPLLGGGYPNDMYSPAKKAAGIDSAYLLNDNGVFGYAYMFGLLGVASLLYWFGKMLYMSIKQYRVNGNYFFVMYLVMLIIDAYNITAWLWVNDSIFMLTLFMCLLECSGRGKSNYHNKKQYSIGEQSVSNSSSL